MPKKAVHFGSLHFTSKKDAIAFLRSMLKGYEPGDEVRPADEAVLREALKHHPKVVEKTGAGIRGFKVRSAEFSSKCFWVMRVDGSTEKFSLKSCV